jgi:hypothetical protein
MKKNVMDPGLVFALMFTGFIAKYIHLAPILGPAGGRYSRNRKLWEEHRDAARMDVKSFFQFRSKEGVAAFLKREPDTLENLIIAIIMRAFGLFIPYVIAGVPAIIAALSLINGSRSVVAIVVFTVAGSFVMWMLVTVLRYLGRFHWVRRGLVTDHPETRSERLRMWLIVPSVLDWVWVPVCFCFAFAWMGSVA